MASFAEPYLLSTANFGETDSADSTTAFPAIEGALPIMDANPPTASDDELGGIVVVPGLMTDLLSLEMVSSHASAVTGSTPTVLMAPRSPSTFGRARGRPRGRTLPPALKYALGSKG